MNNGTLSGIVTVNVTSVLYTIYSTIYSLYYSLCCSTAQYKTCTVLCCIYCAVLYPHYLSMIAKLIMISYHNQIYHLNTKLERLGLIGDACNIFAMSPMTSNHARNAADCVASQQKFPQLRVWMRSHITKRDNKEFSFT